MPIRTKPLANTPASMSEKDWSRQFRQLAGHLGWTLQYHPFLSIYSDKGFPDLTLYRKRNGVGELMFVELKTERGKVSDKQQEWIDALNTVPGIRAYVFRPSQFDAAVAILTAKGEG